MIDTPRVAGPDAPSAGMSGIQISLVLGNRNFGGITPTIVYVASSSRIDTPEDGGIGLIPAPPERVADQRDTAGADAVVLRLQANAALRSQSQEWKQAGRHLLHADTFGIAAVIQRRGPSAVRRNGLERPKAARELADVVQRQQDAPVCFRMTPGDRDETVRIGEGQRPEKHGVEHREHGGVRGDAEREAYQGDDCEEPTGQQRPNRLANGRHLFPSRNPADDADPADVALRVADELDGIAARVAGGHDRAVGA